MKYLHRAGNAELLPIQIQKKTLKNLEKSFSNNLKTTSDWIFVLSKKKAWIKPFCLQYCYHITYFTTIAVLRHKLALLANLMTTDLRLHTRGTLRSLPTPNPIYLHVYTKTRVGNISLCMIIKKSQTNAKHCLSPRQQIPINNVPRTRISEKKFATLFHFLLFPRHPRSLVNRDFENYPAYKTAYNVVRRKAKTYL